MAKGVQFRGAGRALEVLAVTAGRGCEVDIGYEQGGHRGRLLLDSTSIHLASWSYPLPTELEVSLWRGSVMGTLFFGELSFLCKELHTDIPSNPRNDLKM